MITRCPARKLSATGVLPKAGDTFRLGKLGNPFFASPD